MDLVRQDQVAVRAGGILFRYPHAVERAIDEDQRDQEEERANPVLML